jgi:DegV family protein with EDD domain
MGSSCIITDNAAQFTNIISSNDFIFRLIEHKSVFDQPQQQNKLLKTICFPTLFPIERIPVITPPTFQDVYTIISQLINKYDEMFIILHSKELNPVYDITQQILLKLHGRESVYLIDSQTLSAGQGHIIQFAASLLKINTPGTEIEQQLRELVPHVYTLLCTNNLSYLYNSGFIDIGQSIVGEMMALLPIFAIEDGKLNPLEKVKNMHNLIDYFIEFIDEFEQITQVTFLQPISPPLSEAKIIRQYIEENYPQTTFSEIPINTFLASLIGPKGFGLVVSEK